MKPEANPANAGENSSKAPGPFDSRDARAFGSCWFPLSEREPRCAPRSIAPLSHCGACFVRVRRGWRDFASLDSLLPVRFAHGNDPAPFIPTRGGRTGWVFQRPDGPPFCCSPQPHPPQPIRSFASLTCESLARISATPPFGRVALARANRPAHQDTTQRTQEADSPGKLTPAGKPNPRSEANPLGS